MKKLIVRIALVLLTAAMLLSAGASVSAEKRMGSVTFRLEYQGKPVVGGNIHLIRFAQPNGSDWEWTEEFDKCELHLFEMSDPKFAKDLLDYINDENNKSETPVYLPQDTQTIGESGELYFSYLPRGLYLFWQTEPSEGYESLSPFVISMPMTEDGKEVYDINGTPKPQIKPEQATEETTYPKDEKERLPQTGMLMWPIPGCFLYGTFFVLLGIIIRMD